MISKNLLDELSSFLDPQLEEIVKVFSNQELLNNYFVEIPDSDYIDLTIADLASLVARSSNVYGRSARFAGIARAQYKILEARYKKVYKANRVGKNEAEREAAAFSAANDEYVALAAAEAVVNLCESIELAARISSESARKLMDKMQAMQIASSREEKGYFKEKDFSTF